MTPENSFLVDYALTTGAARVRAVSDGARRGPTPTSIRRPAIFVTSSGGLTRPRGGRARGNRMFSSVTIARRRRAAISARVQAIRQRAPQPHRRPAGGGDDRRRRGKLVGPPAPVGVEQLEAVLAPLAETSTLRLSAEGRSSRGLRLAAQRALFRVLRPLWFQQHQFHAQIVAALRLTAGALRTEQQATRRPSIPGCAN